MSARSATPKPEETYEDLHIRDYVNRRSGRYEVWNGDDRLGVYDTPPPLEFRTRKS